MNDRELMQQALEALEVATTPLAKDRQEVLRAQAALRERMAQPEQDPFCYHDGRNIVGKEYADHSDVFPLYTAPPPRQWHGLTEEDLNEVMPYCHNEFDLAEFREFSRNVEAKLRSKNQCK